MMKPVLYLAGILCLAASCTTTRRLSSAMEDDIYYVPGQKALVVEEVENLTGQELHSGQDLADRADESYSRANGSSTPPAAFKRKDGSARINARTGRLEHANLEDLSAQAQGMLADQEEVNATLYENSGYWIGGYKGNEADLAEIQRIVNLYPEGFAYFNSNGQDIAMNLSFDPDWNVYTDNGRYWWFPSNTNIDLYSSLLFGTYPKHIWTVIWNSPRYDSWAFNAGFNSGLHWSFSFGWGSPGWGLGFGWHNSWYRPWYPRYGWYDPWYAPAWGGYYPGWRYPHGYYPHWHYPHRHHPEWSGSGYHPSYRPRPYLRPNNGSGIVSGLRPIPGGHTTNRRSYIARPNNARTGSMVRPGRTTRPSTGSLRPVTRPNSMTRPSSATRPSTTRSGSVTRPSSLTRPSSRSHYTRPTVRSSSGSTTRTTVRPQSYRPAYNNNSTPRHTPGNSGYNSGSGSRSHSPARTGGHNRSTTPVRPTRR